MFRDTKAYSGFAVDDIEAAKDFYGETLGITVADVAPEHSLIQLDLAGDRPVLIYAKDDHTPAGYTILNFPVADVEASVKEMSERGVVFEHYEGTEMETDEHGIFRGGGPLIAWFKDPAGNVLSVIEQD